MHIPHSHKLTRTELRAGESRGCGFVKYATKEEGDSAIRALHNVRSMPPSTALLQVCARPPFAAALSY
jgi:hypothetical protein